MDQFSDHTKHVIDLVAICGAILSAAANELSFWMPILAGGASLVWSSIRIYEWARLKFGDKKA